MPTMLETFADLSTPLVADACVRCEVPLRAAPPGIRPVVPGHRVAGHALPARPPLSITSTSPCSARPSASRNTSTLP